MIPNELFVIINARQRIVADLGDGTPLTRMDAEEGAAFLDNSEPDYIGPHVVVRFVPAGQLPSPETP